MMKWEDYKKLTSQHKDYLNYVIDQEKTLLYFFIGVMMVYLSMIVLTVGLLPEISLIGLSNLIYITIFAMGLSLFLVWIGMVLNYFKERKIIKLVK